jgi:hypothetical protein
MSCSHRYDDCDACHDNDADLRVGLDDDEDAARWCYECADGLLRTLTNAGIVVTARKLVRPVEPSTDVRQEAHDPGWTVEFAVEVLQAATPQAAQLVRTLVEQDGSAAVATLREQLGVALLGPITKSLNTAARYRWRRERLATRISVAEAYELAADTVPIWREALLRLDRRP